MLRFKHIALLLLVLPVLTGCHQTLTYLSDDEIRANAFYMPLLKDICAGDTNKQAARINSITVYRTRFDEKFVETGSVVSIASLNSNSKRPVARYKYLTGYRQDLYLVHVDAACNANAWVYFSVAYGPDRRLPVQVQEGFGKAYLGTANPENGTIYFYRGLSLGYSKSAGRYHISRHDSTQFLFVTDGVSADAGSVDVNRIVIEEKNKFAGPNPFVFNVSERFRGELYRLQFKRVGT